MRGRRDGRRPVRPVVVVDPRCVRPGGKVRGSRDAGVAVFRGIPFAEPPVGELRFAAPRPSRAWDGVRDAISFGRRPRRAGTSAWTRSSEDAPSDDWLTLNVWSPAANRMRGLPVMVWIQGGGYVIGMSSLPEYDGGGSPETAASSW